MFIIIIRISYRNVPKVYDESEIDEIIQSFEEMDDEEYNNAPAELKSIYISHGLDMRRKKLCERRG